MSVKDTQAAIERIKCDQAFSDEVMSHEQPEDRIAFLQKMGYACTPESIKQVQTKIEEEEIYAISHRPESAMGRCTADNYSCN